jgi:spoIIIJ-associated protein
MMPDILGMILWPFRWVIEALLVGFHTALTAVGLDPVDGWTWVLAITGLVLVVRAALIPIFVRQIKSQRKMLEVAPDLKRIQDKYKGKRDQFSREAMTRETMALYGKHGTSPLSSCLPLLFHPEADHVEEHFGGDEGEPDIQAAADSAVRAATGVLVLRFRLPARRHDVLARFELLDDGATVRGHPKHAYAGIRGLRRVARASNEEEPAQGNCRRGGRHRGRKTRTTATADGEEPREARKRKEIMSDNKDAADIAADYIEGLLDIADLDGDLEITNSNGRDYVSVVATDSDHLKVLTKGDTVSALQELTRLAVHTKTGEFSRLILDVAGSRDARSKELERLVDRAVERIEGGAQSAALPPMSSYERKLVHDFVSERGLQSHSEGEGADRHTVISAA